MEPKKNKLIQGESRMVLSGVGDVGTERCWSIDTNFQLDGKF